MTVKRTEKDKRGQPIERVTMTAKQAWKMIDDAPDELLKQRTKSFANAPGYSKLDLCVMIKNAIKGYAPDEPISSLLARYLWHEIGGGLPAEVLAEIEVEIAAIANVPPVKKTKDKKVRAAVKVEDAVPAPDPTPRPTITADDLKRADRLLKLAQNLDAKIADKRRPWPQSVAHTRKRDQEFDQRCKEGDRFERVQSVLLALADLHRRGEAAAFGFDKINSVSALETVMNFDKWPQTDDYRFVLTRAGFTSANYTSKRKALLDFITGDGERDRAKRLRDLELKAASLVGQIPGFFPTPRSIVEKMLAGVVLPPNTIVCDPEAGAGHILDVIRERFPGVMLLAIERNGTLCELLQAKEYVVHCSDFLIDDPVVDVFVMNPPFEDGQDGRHVQHAYECLNSGGSLIALMSPSLFTNSRQRGINFREWFKQVGGRKENLPTDAFKESGTGVVPLLVRISKPK